jgi:hypothetical protein
MTTELSLHEITITRYYLNECALIKNEKYIPAIKDKQYV